MRSNSCILIVAPLEYSQKLSEVSEDLVLGSTKAAIGRIHCKNDKFVCLILMQDSEVTKDRNALVKSIMSSSTFSRDIGLCFADIHIAEDVSYHVDSMYLCKARCGLLVNWLSDDRDKLLTMFLNDAVSDDIFCRTMNSFMELPYPVTREVFKLMRQHICGTNKG